MPRLWAPLAYTALLYCSLPFVRAATDVLRIRGLLRLALFALCVALAAAAVAAMVRRLRIPWLRALSLAAAGGAIYGAIYASMAIPEEFAHFIQYGPLPVLWFWALGPRMGLVAVLCAVTGLGDEVIQGMLSGRYFEWRDVGLNWVASALGIGAWVIAKTVR